MRKTFMGVKLRALRAERGLSQTALAQALELSPSYLNQIEQNQRPLTVPVLLKLHRALGVDIQQFSEDEEARLIAGLREALADAAEPIALPELQEVAAQMPALGRALIALHRRRLQAGQRPGDAIGERGRRRGRDHRHPGQRRHHAAGDAGRARDHHPADRVRHRHQLVAPAAQQLLPLLRRPRATLPIDVVHDRS